ncbi:hypothetical protein LUZ60_011076 [Juncus effusus]|nr:hypothetical protein LUZ60_011076 [Juncus effusus]
MSEMGWLPAGFRFHPTDEELISYYLRNRAASVPCPVSIIAEVNIYKYDPWQLPSKAIYGENEWYFFSPRDRKYPNGVRPNRAASTGYWKATGIDKPIISSKTNENIGVKKALVFYRGKPPKGIKTEWIMHEYRVIDSSKNRKNNPIKNTNSMRLDDWVLCRIYKKTSHSQPSDQEEEEQSVTQDPNSTNSSNPSPISNTSFTLPKSASLVNLLESFDSLDYPALSRLLDISDLPALDLGSINNSKLNQPLMNNNNFDTYEQVYQTECSVWDPQNAPKRPRLEKTSAHFNFVDQNLMSQNFHLNSNFGLN